jgi:hypothetical protein
MRLSKSLAVILIIVVVIIFVGAGVWIGMRFRVGGAAANGPSLSPYSAVYLSTGDVYFGTLEWSPSPHMEDAWFLQRGTNAEGNATVGVYPFSQVTWGPSDVVYFNSSQIIFWTRLSSTSSVAQLIANPSAATAAEQNVAPVESVSTSTATSSTTSSTSTVSH